MIATIPVITEQMQSWMDKDYSGFNGWPTDNADVASRWADIADKLFAEVIPLSTTQIPAREAFISIALALNSTVNGFIILSNAFNVYAAIIATGMLPLYTATPPMPLLMLHASGQHAAIEAASIATQLCTWALAGIAINNNTTISVNWL